MSLERPWAVLSVMCYRDRGNWKAGKLIAVCRRFRCLPMAVVQAGRKGVEPGKRQAAGSPCNPTALGTRIAGPASTP